MTCHESLKCSSRVREAIATCQEMLCARHCGHIWRRCLRWILPWVYDDGWGRNRHALTALGRRQTAVSSPFLASLNTRASHPPPPPARLEVGFSQDLRSSAQNAPGRGQLCTAAPLPQQCRPRTAEPPRVRLVHCCRSCAPHTLPWRLAVHYAHSCGSSARGAQLRQPCCVCSRSVLPGAATVATTAAAAARCCSRCCCCLQPDVNAVREIQSIATSRSS